LPEGFRLVGVIGGPRPQAGVDKESYLTLTAWRAFQVPSGNIHLVGHCVELAEGRASTRVVAGDAATGRCVTSSGRAYTLYGPSGHDSNGEWVWGQLKRIQRLADEDDVSDRLFALLPFIGDAS
jgi:hypothetical protein